MPADDLQSVLDLLTLPIPDFVDASYQLLLGRHAEPAEIREQSGLLHGGLGRLRFLSGLTLSGEYRKRAATNERSNAAFLEELYMRYLGRPIDPQGMDKYLSLLSRGRARDRIRRNIAASREARAKRTLWFELDRLLADERMERHWLLRWYGRSERRARRDNLMHEILLRPVAEPRTRTGHLSNEAVERFPDVRSEAFAGLSREALQVLARARQAARRA